MLAFTRQEGRDKATHSKLDTAKDSKSSQDAPPAAKNVCKSKNKWDFEMEFKLIQGDCIEKMRELPDASVDAIVTDPPYNLSFMSKSWDTNESPQAFQSWCKTWAIECLRVLKTGGFALVFGGTRTHHRLTCGLEDAGFLIRDELEWIYLSGFPKAQSLDKLIDRKLGMKEEREVIGELENHRQKRDNPLGEMLHLGNGKETAPASAEAKDWLGWKTPALKPAHEPIILAQKPCEGSITENVLKHGVGGFNIDACRIPLEENDNDLARCNKIDNGMFGVGNNNNNAQIRKELNLEPTGRFPSNVLMTEPCFDGKVEGVIKAKDAPETGHVPRISKGSQEGHIYSGGYGGMTRDEQYFKNSSFSKFFLIPKSCASEKNENAFGELLLDEKHAPTTGNNIGGKPHNEDNPRLKRNIHPTVKPILLMRHLIKLVTREGALVLDPFVGSGTTILACRELRRSCIGIEQSAEYCEIVKARFGKTLGDPLELVLNE